MKVYVIEKGCYSDRHIVGVVETESEAKELCSNIFNDEVSYSEYDTKQFQDKRLRFIVGEDWNDGWECRYDDYDLYFAYPENSIVYDGCYVVYAESPQQAIKIAQDMKAMKLAEKEGIL